MQTQVTLSAASSYNAEKHQIVLIFLRQKTHILDSEQLGAFGHVIYHQEPMIPYLQNRSMGSAFYHILKCMYGIAWHLGSVQKC